MHDRISAKAFGLQAKCGGMIKAWLAQVSPGNQATSSVL
jgi:hypothetical protein